MRVVRLSSNSGCAPAGRARHQPARGEGGRHVRAQAVKVGFPAGCARSARSCRTTAAARAADAAGRGQFELVMAALEQGFAELALELANRRLTALCVTLSSSAARVKLPVRPAISKAFSAFSAGILRLTGQCRVWCGMLIVGGGAGAGSLNGGDVGRGVYGRRLACLVVTRLPAGAGGAAGNDTNDTNDTNEGDTHHATPAIVDRTAIFRETARHLSFNRAAVSLCVTQGR